jgi:hypothetical protein
MRDSPIVDRSFATRRFPAAPNRRNPIPPALPSLSIARALF